MISKSAGFIILVSLSSQSFAFQCYLTLVKDTCWKNYEVNVNVLDSNNNDKVLTTVVVAKDKTWARQPFDCNPGMKLMYSATFKPVFWQSEVGKSYAAFKYWTLPNKIGADESAWDIPVCFASAFSAVPFPPDALGNCKCNFFDIPSVPPSVPKK
ncbi:MAG: hypothetical protein H0U57_12350 [Tatlockia sp.]|nr:hypothetical protein [Tatlockia sp.]